MRDGTVAPWCRADAGPSLKPAQVDRASDLPDDVNGGALALAPTATALTLAPTATASSGAVDVTVVDDGELDQVCERHVREEGTAADTTRIEGKSPPKQRKRKRSPAEPRAPGWEPRAKRGPGKAADQHPKHRQCQ